MRANALLPTVVALLSLGFAGCGEAVDELSERGSAVVDLCRGHGGVAALEDDLVICRDQTFHEAPE